MGRRRARSHKPHKPKKPAPVQVHPEPSIPGVNAPGRATFAYPTARQATGGAMPIEELDPLREVGQDIIALESQLVAANGHVVALEQQIQQLQQQIDPKATEALAAVSELAKALSLLAAA